VLPRESRGGEFFEARRRFHPATARVNVSTRNSAPHLLQYVYDNRSAKQMRQVYLQLAKNHKRPTVM